MGLFVRDKNFYKKLLIIAIPVTLQGMITIGINLTDTVMLGSFGEYQLSASSLANNFYSIFQILCMGMGFGTAVMTSQFWGRRDSVNIRSATTIMFRICLIIATLFSLVSFFLPGYIMSAYSGEKKIVDYGIKYLQVMSFTYILQGLSLTTTIILRSISKVKIPLFSTILSFFINIFFNWVFIFGNLGAPRLEIAGAAIGTLFARILEFIIIFGYFIVVEKDIHYRVADFFKPCKRLLPEFIRFSVPVVISDLLLGLGNNAVAIVMGHIGAEFVAANAIITVVVQISTIFTQGVSSASSIVTGNTLGEGETEKAYHQGVTFFALSVMIGLVAGFIIMVLAPTIIGFYNISEDTKRIAQELMKAVAFTVVFQTISTVMTKGVLRGGGDTKFLMVADILFLWIVSVPVGAYVGLVLHVPAFWIFTAMKLDQIIKSVWCIKRLYSRKWIKIVRA